MPKVQQVTATLIDRRQLNQTTYDLTLQLSSGTNHLSGQYINLNLDNQFRAYSITSLPNSDQLIHLCIETTKTMGPGSRFAKSLSYGIKLKALYPQGQFLLSGEHKPCLFIATGVGIAPFKSMTESLLNLSGFSKPVLLIWGLRYESDIYWEDIWQHLKNLKSNFTYIICLSREKKQASTNHVRYEGYVTSYLQTLADLTGWQAYVCGNQQLVGRASDILQPKGVFKKDIYSEKFY